VCVHADSKAALDAALADARAPMMAQSVNSLEHIHKNCGYLKMRSPRKCAHAILAVSSIAAGITWTYLRNLAILSP